MSQDLTLRVISLWLKTLNKDERSESLLTLSEAKRPSRRVTESTAINSCLSTTENLSFYKRRFILIHLEIDIYRIKYGYGLCHVCNVNPALIYSAG